MEMYHFKAKDMSTGLKKVYDKLGPRALIISNKTIAEGVEIQAAVEIKEITTNDLTAPCFNAEPNNFKNSNQDKSLSQISSEIKQVRQLIEAQVTQFTKKHQNIKYPTKLLIFDQLEKLGFPNEFINSIFSKVQNFESFDKQMNAVKKFLFNTLQTCEDDITKTGGIIALVGPTGVGKTTMLAKLATHYTLHHGASKVGIINHDNYRIGAKEQAQTYANILGIDIHHTNSLSNVEQALHEMYHKDLILIDTSGTSKNSSEITKQLSHLTNHMNLKCYLTIAANLAIDVITEAIEVFTNLPLTGSILTKVDETLRLAPGLSTLMNKQLPIAYLSTGQIVPDDFIIAKKASLLDIIFQNEFQHPYKYEFEELA